MNRVIGIDCFKLQKGMGKSIGIYVFVENFIKNLTRYSDDFDFIIFGNAENRKDFEIEGIEFVQVPLDHKKKIICLLWELIFVRHYINVRHVDKMIFPRGFAPLGKGTKNIIVVHDMIPFYYHKQFPRALNIVENAYIMKRLRASIRSSSIVVTISEFSKSEMERIVPESSAKIKVIYHGYDTIEKGEGNNLLIKDEYIIGITSSLPHKNAQGLILAYEKYILQVEKPLKLVIVGIKDLMNYEEQLSEVAKKNIIYKNYLDDDQFYTLFKNAKCLLFLSLIEGYGRPPLEAMQFNIPVICSKRSALPEIVGEAGILVDPENPTEIAQALVDILSDDTVREKLIRYGQENLKRFLWEEQIKKYIELL